MSLLTEAQYGPKLAEHLNSGLYKRVLLPFWHGVGDVVMVLPIIEELRKRYSNIEINLGLCKGLDQESFVPDAVLLEGDWREKWRDLGYDLVFPINFPLEKLEDTNMTKSEISCWAEVGIPPVSGHLTLKPKRLIAVHFQITSVPWVANADHDVAQAVWNDIKEVGFVPIESHFEHIFHNPINQRYDFVDTHVRACTPRISTLMALLGSCAGFVGVVSGNFHLALSILGPKKVLLLEKDLKAGHFTKEKIATANLKDYKGEVKSFLEGL